MDIIVLVSAGLFDILGLIPWVGIVTNPIFSVILYIAYRNKRENLALKLFLTTVLGVGIESMPLVNLLPTNLGNAYLVIYVFK